MSKPYTTQFFTWIHTEKTGGTWLHSILANHSPSDWQAFVYPPAHVCLDDVPSTLEDMGLPERAALPIIAAVRNPWDWYVSMYFFMAGHCAAGTGGFIRPREEWNPTLVDWSTRVASGLDVEGFRKGIRRIYEQRPPAWRGQEPFLRSSRGISPLVYRFERLRDDFLGVIESTGAQPSESMRHALLATPAANRSEHRHYTDYYDYDTRRMVEEMEPYVIEQFGYEFCD